MILEGRVPPRPDGNDWMKGTVPPGPICHSGGKPPQSMRCRDSPRRLRLREAFGVRLPAGAFGQQHSAPGATVPSQLLRNHRLGCSDGDTSVGWQASSRPRPHRKPRLPKPQARDGVGAVPPMVAVKRVSPMPDGTEAVPPAQEPSAAGPIRGHVIRVGGLGLPRAPDRRGNSRFRRCTGGRLVYLCPIRFEPTGVWRSDAGHSAL